MPMCGLGLLCCDRVIAGVAQFAVAPNCIGATARSPPSSVAAILALYVGDLKGGKMAASREGPFVPVPS